MNSYLRAFFTSIIIVSATPAKLYAAKAIPIQIGEWYLEPTIDITFGRTESEFGDFDQSSSLRQRVNYTYTQIEPKFRLYNKNKKREISITYEIDNVDFKGNPLSDSLSSYVSGEYKRSISDKSDVSFSMGLEDGTRPQGVRTGLQSASPLLEDQPVDFTSKEAVLTYEFYGEQNAGHNFSLSLEHKELDFQSVEVFEQGRSFESNAVEARWRYLWSQGSGVFINAKQTQFDYERENSGFNVSLDNKESQVMFGFEWRARRNISGEFSVGVIKKTFDNIEVDVEIPAFYGRVEIFPSRLDTFRIEGQNNPIEQAGEGVFQEYQDIELSWLRRLSPRWSMEASASAGRIDYQESSRKDRFYDYGVLFEYRVSRVADLIFGFKYYNDDSNEDEFDYNGSNIFITYSTGL